MGRSVIYFWAFRIFTPLEKRWAKLHHIHHHIKHNLGLVAVGDILIIMRGLHHETYRLLFFSFRRDITFKWYKNKSHHYDFQNNPVRKKERYSSISRCFLLFTAASRRQWCGRHLQTRPCWRLLTRWMIPLQVWSSVRNAYATSCHPYERNTSPNPR